MLVLVPINSRKKEVTLLVDFVMKICSSFSNAKSFAFHPAVGQRSSD